MEMKPPLDLMRELEKTEITPAVIVKDEGEFKFVEDTDKVVPPWEDFVLG